MKPNRQQGSANVVHTAAYQLPVLGKSLLIGLLVGVVVSLYRLLLDFLETSAFSMYDFIRKEPLWIVPMFILLLLVALLVGRIMKAQPHCSSRRSHPQSPPADHSICDGLRPKSQSFLLVKTEALLSCYTF